MQMSKQTGRGGWYRRTMLLDFLGRHQPLLVSSRFPVRLLLLLRIRRLQQLLFLLGLQLKLLLFHGGRRHRRGRTTAVVTIPAAAAAVTDVVLRHRVIPVIFRWMGKGALPGGHISARRLLFPPHPVPANPATPFSASHNAKRTEKIDALPPLTSSGDPDPPGGPFPLQRRPPSKPTPQTGRRVNGCCITPPLTREYEKEEDRKGERSRVTTAADPEEEEEEDARAPRGSEREVLAGAGGGGVVAATTG